MRTEREALIDNLRFGPMTQFMRGWDEPMRMRLCEQMADELLASGWTHQAHHLQTPLGRAEDGPEDVRAARSQRERSQPGPGTADPAPALDVDEDDPDWFGCNRPDCNRPQSEHEFGVFCP